MVFGKDVVCIKEHGKFGIFTNTLKELLPCIYDSIELLPNETSILINGKTIKDIKELIKWKIING